jgi:hypothetical protein
VRDAGLDLKLSAERSPYLARVHFPEHDGQRRGTH